MLFFNNIIRAIGSPSANYSFPRQYIYKDIEERKHSYNYICGDYIQKGEVQIVIPVLAFTNISAPRIIGMKNKKTIF